MTEYNEGARGRARYWMERAQRAEAECERLRDALRYVSEMFSGGHGSVEERAEAMNQIAEKALTTPPPEGEPELLTGHGDQRPKRGGWAPGFYANTCQSCGRSFVGDKWAWTCADCAYANDAPHTPDQPEGEKLDSDMQEVLDRNRRRNYLSGEAKQAHGDALAALDRTQYRRWKDRGGARGYVCGDVPVALLVQVIEDYRRLTASGVPYVPVRNAVRNLRDDINLQSNATLRSWVRKHVAELEAVIAAAPSDGE